MSLPLLLALLVWRWRRAHLELGSDQKEEGFLYQQRRVLGDITWLTV